MGGFEKYRALLHSIDLWLSSITVKPKPGRWRMDARVLVATTGEFDYHTFLGG